MGVLGLHGDSAENALLGASLSLIEQGAEVVVLGCAVRLLQNLSARSVTDELERQGMAPLTRTMEEKIRSKTSKAIPVIDGVQAAIETAIALARMGLRS